MKKIVFLLICLLLLLILPSCNNKNNMTILFFDGSNVIKKTFNEGEEITLDPLTKEGYDFLGWKLDGNLITSLTYVEGELSLEATWKIKSYKVTFKDGNNILDEKEYEYNTMPIAIENPSKDDKDGIHYVFDGWDKEITKVVSDQTYNAKWVESKIEYTVKFFDGDKELSSKVYYYNDEVEVPNCEKENYNFIGWDKEITKVTNNVNYYAKFEEILYTIKFVSDNKEISNKKYHKGDKVELPTTPTKKGYNFIGWDKEITDVVENTTYTACFESASAITSLEGLKISFLGDSITTFYDPNSLVNSYYHESGRYYYPTYCKSVNSYTLTWWGRLYLDNKMVLGINNSWSGSTAYGTSESCGMHDSRINTLDDNGSPDIVIVYLGTNDAASEYTTTYTLENYEKALRTIIEKINKLCDADIFFCEMSYSFYKNGQYWERVKEFNKVIEKVADENNCGLIPLQDYICEDNFSMYLNDNLHYNLAGTELVSQVCAKHLSMYYGIKDFTEPDVKHGVAVKPGEIVATSNDPSNFFNVDVYKKNAFFFETSKYSMNPLFSRRIQIVKETNGKYYVKAIDKSGASVTYDCDYVLMYSSDCEEYQNYEKAIANVKVGDLVEFDDSSYPCTIKFKEGDGGYQGGGTSHESHEIAGCLYSDVYNKNLFADYDSHVIVYSSFPVGNTLQNFYVIGVTKQQNGKYKVEIMKPTGQGFTDNYGNCDYYIMIYSSLTQKSFYDSCSLNQEIEMIGDINTDGYCNWKFN